jgi:ABC-type dipeptide/oligopeptide/nickel transport system permease subunit
MSEPANRAPTTPARTSRSPNYAPETEAGSSSLLVAEQTREAAGTRVRTPLKDAIRRFSKNWAALISLALIVVLILGAIFAPFLHTTSPYTPDFSNTGAGPSLTHLFGTDPEGRDLYTRVLYAMRIPLIVSLVGTLITVALGMVLGLVAGYFGGWIDSLLSRFTDLMFAFPAFLLTIIIVTLYGNAFDAQFPGGVGRAIILTGVFALVSWPPLMRFVRSLALTLKEQQFVEAARTVGTSNGRIIIRHLMPNTWGLVLVQAALNVAFIIGAEAVLSIFGLGVNEPVPDLGNMLNDGTAYMDANGWGLFFPCLFLILLILAFTFVGDGIRDAVDPKSSR